MEPVFHFGYLRPPAKSAIGLDELAHRSGHSAKNPFVTNYRPIRAQPNGAEVGPDLHGPNVANGRNTSNLRPNEYQLAGGPMPGAQRLHAGRPR
jgi:hypothetical protein